jgi:hypothetical protein
MITVLLNEGIYQFDSRHFQTERSLAIAWMECKLTYQSLRKSDKILWAFVIDTNENSETRFLLNKETGKVEQIKKFNLEIA